MRNWFGNNSFSKSKDDGSKYWLYYLHIPVSGAQADKLLHFVQCESDFLRTSQNIYIGETYVKTREFKKQATES